MTTETTKTMTTKTPNTMATMIQTQTFSGEKAGYVQSGPINPAELFKKRTDIEFVTVSCLEKDHETKGVRFYRNQFSV